MNVIEHYNGWRFIIRCCTMHFLLGFCVGLLAYWLTLTTLLHFSVDEVGVFSIHLFSLSVALCFSVLSHILEDYLWSKF